MAANRGKKARCGLSIKADHEAIVRLGAKEVKWRCLDEDVANDRVTSAAIARAGIGRLGWPCGLPARPSTRELPLLSTCVAQRRWVGPACNSSPAQQASSPSESFRT